jgi:hypothetical protein
MPGGMAQVVEHLPSKCKAPNSNLRTIKKKKKMKEKGSRLIFQKSAESEDTHSSSNEKQTWIGLGSIPSPT